VKSWILWGKVDPTPAAVSVDVNAYKIEITAKKIVPGEWPAYEANTATVPTAPLAPEPVVRPNTATPSVDPRTYPSSKKKVDWETLEQQAKKDEEDEKPEGEAALHKLFQKIYSGASEETRRAMIKSYQTSGGTVLSTNWKEVGQKDYTKDRQAPKGQEFVNWS